MSRMALDLQRQVDRLRGTATVSRTRKADGAAADRAESKVKKAVRPQVAARDGHCRLSAFQSIVGPCSGPSEWNHLQRRSETRGMAPERRHRTGNSCMNCQRHHQMIDGNILSASDSRIHVDWQFTAKEADGPMSYRYRGRTFREAR